MSKAVKLKNNLYLDSTSIVHNKRKLSDIFYPIGSVYISVNDVNPATLYGGTWQKVSGYYLLAWDQEYGKMGVNGIQMIQYCQLNKCQIIIIGL